MSSFRGLSIGISAIFANQRALDVTGHNISNVNTTGYTRQMIANSNSFYQKVGYSGNGNQLQLGTGVDVQEIRQYRDEFLDKKYKKENTELGYWSARYSSIEELETIFNDNSEEGLQSVMNDFWNSWEQLSKPTGGLTARASVKENAIAFVETVKSMDQLINNFKRSKNKEIIENVDRVNTIAKSVAELNLKIRQIEANGAVANDFRDERNLLIDELSQMAKIQVFDGSMVNIAIEGHMLVESGRYEQIATVPDPNNNGYAKLVWKGTNDDFLSTKGSLMSMIESRDVLFEDFGNKLNNFVIGVAEAVNAIHITGYGTKDNVHRYFFVNEANNSGTGINLSNIAFNPQLNEYDNIAAGEEDGNVEDNRIALKIAGLRLNEYFSDAGYEDETNAANRKYNFDEFYRNIIGDLGNKGLEASTSVDAQKLLVDQLDYRRQSVSAVSLDEEMSNLIKFEHSYNAATRIVNAIDEMLETIVNKTGLVGR
jgi:flagellar hook-associated protein 1